MIIYRPSDRIPVQIGELKFLISPLTHGQKMNILAMKKMEGGVEKVDAWGRAMLSVKYAVKDVEGLALAGGRPYELERDADGTLTRECAEELLDQLGSSDKLTMVCLQLMNGPEAVKVEGVDFKLSEVATVEKKD